MAPIRLSHVWYRRLHVALVIVSLIYVTLFTLQALEILSVPPSAHVGLFPAIASGVIGIISLVLIFLDKRIPHQQTLSLIAFGIFLLTTAYLTQTTGGVSSVFLVIWSVALFMSPIFGIYGWLPSLVLVGAYVTAEFLTKGFSIESYIIIVLSSLVPLIIGLFVWREISDTGDTSTRNVKNLADQLSEVATKSEIIINAIGDGVIAVDGTGVIQLINPAAQEMLGWGKQDALMLSYKSILKLADLNGKSLADTQDPIQQVLNTNQQARNNNVIAITNSGKKISISLVSTPIGDPGAGAIAVFRDTTNEREEEREQAEFISTASHEMRTPVASIEGYLGLALNPQTASIDQRAHDFIIKAHEAAEHLGRLFQDLLDVSKSEDGRLVNNPKVIDIVPFTQTIVEGLSQKANDKGLTLRFVPNDNNGTDRGIKNVAPVYYVNLDNDHIREVLNNLIENAIKYTPQGEVTVDIVGNDDRVTISVKDSGLGIPKEDIPHLFQKFYRVNNTDRQAIGGTGLGLYLCRRLVEAMQGRIWVESEFQKGSTFFVELPRISNQEANALLATQTQENVHQTETQLVPETTTTAVAPTASIPVTVVESSTLPPAPAPAPVPASTPAPAPTPAPALTPTAAPPLNVQTPPQVVPATTVPRGESLTREQINQRVQQLEELARQQRGAITPPTRQ